MLAQLRALPEVGEVVYRSACNRVEVYATARKSEDRDSTLAASAIERTLCGRAGESLSGAVSTPLFRYTDALAVSRVFRVAASLDSPYRPMGVAFRVIERLSIRDVGDFGAVLPAAHLFVYLRINRLVAGSAARLATGLLARLWPGGACTRRTTCTNFMPSSRALLSHRHFLFASCHTSGGRAQMQGVA